MGVSTGTGKVAVISVMEIGFVAIIVGGKKITPTIAAIKNTDTDRVVPKNRIGRGKSCGENGAREALESEGLFGSSKTADKHQS
jgi:hypothetical protein